MDNEPTKPVNNQFPAFQYSEFIKTGKRDGQIVVRAENWVDFMDQMTKLGSFVRAAKTKDLGATPQNDVSMRANAQRPVSTGDVPKCKKCGSEMWDNRAQKAEGKFTTGPDFNCKADGSHVIWPPKPNTAQPEALPVIQVDKVAEEVDTGLEAEKIFS